MESQDFNFKEWAKCLPKDVAKTLAEEGFDSLMALANVDEADVRSLPLKKGHIVATVAAIRQLQTTHGGGPLTAPATDSGKVTEGQPNLLDRLLGGSQRPVISLDQLLGATSHSQVQQQQPVHDSATLRADLEPSVYLRTSTTGDALKIVNFISMCESDSEGVEHKIAEGVAIVIPRSRPKLEAVTPAQWITANSRIMATLIQKGELTGQGVLDYVAYTAKIGEMATRFTWTSVLQYDDQYRASQAAFKFRWGSDCQHLALVALRERQKQQQHPASAGPSLSRSHHKNGGGGEACKLWNRGQCTYQHCKFQHVCSTCGKADHDVRSHSQQQQQQQQQQSTKP
jgi:hypothetical protein